MLDFYSDALEVNRMIAKKKYHEAVDMLRDLLRRDPGNMGIRKQLGDLMPMIGRPLEGYKIFDRLADEYAASFQLTKAVAVLKKMQRLFPERKETLGTRLEALFQKRDELVANPYNLQGPSVVNDLDIEGVALAEPDFVDEDDEPEEEESKPKEPRLDAFFSSPLFRSFSEEELLTIMKAFELKTLEPGQIVFSEGEAAGGLMFLVSGQLRVFVRNRSGANEEVREMSEGSFFGEISLLSGKPRTATITCTTQVELLELDKPTLVEIAKTHPEIPGILKSYYMRRANSPEERRARTTEKG